PSAPPGQETSDTVEVTIGVLHAPDGSTLPFISKAPHICSVPDELLAPNGKTLNIIPLVVFVTDKVTFQVARLVPDALVAQPPFLGASFDPLSIHVVPLSRL